MVARAVGLVTRRHDQTLDRSRLPASRLKHVVRPADVGFERQERSTESHPNERLRPKVKHDRSATFGNGTLHIRERLEVTFSDGDTSDVAAPKKLGSEVAVAEQDGDVRALVQKALDKTRSNESSRTRYEDGPIYPERTIRGHPVILTGGGQASSVSPHAGTVFLYGLAVGEGVGLADGVDSDGAGDGEGEGVMLAVGSTVSAVCVGAADPAITAS